MLEAFLADLTQIGLIADVAGAVFVSKAVFLRRNSSIFNSTGASLGYSREAAVGAIIAKREAILGSALLVSGFVCQFFGSFHVGPPEENWSLLLVIAVVLTIASLLASPGIRYWSQRTADKLVAEYSKKSA